MRLKCLKIIRSGAGGPTSLRLVTARRARNRSEVSSYEIFTRSDREASRSR